MIEINILWSTILFFIGIFLLNTVSSGIGTLKNILVAKQAGVWATIVVAIDATVYYVVLKSVASSGNFIISIIAYVLGHTTGAVIGDKIENKMAIGVYELKIFIDNEIKLKKINNFCYQNNYSISIIKSLTPGFTKRYILLIQCDRKNKNKLIKGINNLGIENLTMTIDELKEVSGKIVDRK